MAVDEGRRTQLLRGVLDLCLLAVMQEGPAYGYEMTKRLRARGLSIVGEGSIYPLLGRLEREGLVETYRAASNGGPPREDYRAPAPGQAACVALAIVGLVLVVATPKRTTRVAVPGTVPRVALLPPGLRRRPLLPRVRLLPFRRAQMVAVTDGGRGPVWWIGLSAIVVGATGAIWSTLVLRR